MANVSGYKSLRFLGQSTETSNIMSIVPAKNSHLKVVHPVLPEAIASRV